MNLNDQMLFDKVNKRKGKDIITSQIEHPAMINPCNYLKKQGYDINKYQYGIISFDSGIGKGGMWERLLIYGQSGKRKIICG